MVARALLCGCQGFAMQLIRHSVLSSVVKHCSCQGIVGGCQGVAMQFAKVF